MEDRRRPQKQRVNDRIRVRQVLLIDDSGDNLGVMETDKAREIAYSKDLDLVEISPDARPPVCRVMDYGKWKYEQDMKAKQARKARTTVTTKEIKFRPKIGEADYITKRNHVKRFLEAGNKVKVTIMFRGREVVHSDLGKDILDRVAEELAEHGTVEQRPNLEGRNMIMVMAPTGKSN